MSKPDITKWPSRNQAEIRAELSRVPHPKPYPAGDLLPQRAVALKRRRTRPTPDATAFFVKAGLPQPVREHRFVTDRKWRLDYAWPDRKVALEVEGGIWTQGRHTRGSGFVRDMDKYNRLTVEGWRLYRVQPSGLLTANLVEILRLILK